jgi:hypothetical protein
VKGDLIAEVAHDVVPIRPETDDNAGASKDTKIFKSQVAKGLQRDLQNPRWHLGFVVAW